METQTVAPVRVAVANTFNVPRYLITLAAGLGISVDDIPDDVKVQASAKLTPGEVNKIVVEQWFMNRVAVPTTLLTPEQVADINALGSRDNTGQARSLKASIEQSIVDINRRARDINNFLEAMSKHREDLDIILNAPPKDLSLEVLATCKDNWFKYDAALTNDINARHKGLNNFRRTGLCFITPPIVLTNRNTKAGTDLQVPMGQYRIEVRLGESNIKVFPHAGNTTVDGYIHPHINGENTVCWGNAQEIFNQAMRTLNFSEAMHHLRIILTTYNSASPYAQLKEYAALVDPRTMHNGPTVYQQYGTKKLWTRTDQLPYNYDRQQAVKYVEQGEDDDGEYYEHALTLTHVHRLLIASTQNRVPDTYYFVLCKDGTFFQLDEDSSDGWDN